MGSFTKKAPRNFWLVVSTPLKNNSQLGVLSPIYGKNMFQTTNQNFMRFYRISLVHHFDFMGFNKTNWEI